MAHQNADMIRHIVKQHLILVDLISVTFYDMWRNYHNIYINAYIHTYILDIAHNAEDIFEKVYVYDEYKKQGYVFVCMIYVNVRFYRYCFNKQ